MEKKREGDIRELVRDFEDFVGESNQIVNKYNTNWLMIGSGVVESSNRRVAPQNSNKLECPTPFALCNNFIGLTHWTN